MYIYLYTPHASLASGSRLGSIGFTLHYRERGGESYFCISRERERESGIVRITFIEKRREKESERERQTKKERERECHRARVKFHVESSD